jgi:hypothetical protein
VTSAEKPTANGQPRAGVGVGNVAAGRAALDVMLTDAAVSQGRASRFLDPVATAKLTGALARRPRRLAAVSAGLVLSSRVSPPAARSWHRPRAIAGSRTAPGTRTGCSAA